MNCWRAIGFSADFAAHSNAVYLGGYSGRVVMVNPDGERLRVYDTGVPPKRITDTGEYLYILADTRLYILRDDSLHGLIDSLDRGELVLAKSGFGLLENKRLRWFTKVGDYLGSVLSKDPIRRVYCTTDAMVVETRQRRGRHHWCTAVVGVKASLAHRQLPHAYRAL